MRLLIDAGLSRKEIGKRLEAIEALVEDAKAQGAELLTGGRRPPVSPRGRDGRALVGSAAREERGAKA